MIGKKLPIWQPRPPRRGRKLILAGRPLGSYRILFHKFRP